VTYAAEGDRLTRLRWLGHGLPAGGTQRNVGARTLNDNPTGGMDGATKHAAELEHIVSQVERILGRPFQQAKDLAGTLGKYADLTAQLAFAPSPGGGHARAELGDSDDNSPAGCARRRVTALDSRAKAPWP
jgi:hypothetical protein